MLSVVFWRLLTSCCQFCFTDFATMSFSIVGSFLLLLLITSTGNSFEVMNTRSPLITQTGCTVLLTCGGFGESIEWRKFGESEALGTNKNHTTSVTITTILTDGDNMSVPYLISNATLIATPSIDNERFICYIFGSPDGRTVSHQIQLRVEPSVVTINPLIPEVNISTYNIGAPITIGCPVQTCAEEVSVQFLRGDEVISVIESTSAAPTAYNLQLTVSEDIAGAYACKADTVNPDNSTIAHFNIVGTPLPPLPTTKPPTSSDSGTTGSPGTTTDDNGDNNDNDNNNNDSAVVMDRLSLSSLIILLLTVNLIPWL